MNAKPADIDAYLSSLPPDARSSLQALRQAIRAAAPAAEEAISYGMAAFKYQGRPLAYFGASKNHCAIYGMSAEMETYEEELAGYDTSKGTLRFPKGEALPEALVRSLVSARIAAIEAEAAARQAKRLSPRKAK